MLQVSLWLLASNRLEVLRHIFKELESLRLPCIHAEKLAGSQVRQQLYLMTYLLLTGLSSALMEKNSLGTLSRFYCLPVEQILTRVVEMVVEAAGTVDPLAVEAVEEVAWWGQWPGRTL